LPVFIPQIDLSSTTNATPTLFNPSTTIYTITLTYTYTDQETGVATTYCSAATPVPWYPEAINSVVPFNNSSMLTQDNTSTWYYCYSYQYWIYMINQAFTSAYNSLNDVVSDSGLVLPSSNPPFMSWNAGEAIAILNCDIGSESSGGYLTLYSNGDTSVRDPNTGINAFEYNQISIFFNSALYNLFNSFPMTRANWGSSVNVSFPSSINSSGEILSSSYTSVPGGNIQIIVNSYGSLNIAQISSSPFSNSTTSYCQVYQEYSTTPAWNPISSIVFTSASIPVVAGNAGSPLVYDGTYNVQASNNAFIIMEITDFASSNADYRGFINYTPSGEYRLIDLQGMRFKMKGGRINYNIQSVIFNKNYNTIKQADKWLKDNDFKIDKSTYNFNSPNYLRYRQHKPLNDGYEYRMKLIDPERMIFFVMEYPNN
jgi:hypothetical protein